MDLAMLHTAVRSLARGGAADRAALGPAERAALRALQRRLRSVEQRLERLTPPSGSQVWMSPPSSQPDRSGTAA